VRREQRQKRSAEKRSGCMVRATHAEDSERPCLPQVVGRRQSISMHPWQARHPGHRHHQNLIALPPSSGDRVELSKEPELAGRPGLISQPDRGAAATASAKPTHSCEKIFFPQPAQLSTAVASARSAMPSACRS
jgi:hypothetical protein